VIRLRFIKSKGITSDLITFREGTCMPFAPSHCECVTPDGKFYIGQHELGGMLARPAGYDADQIVHETFVDLPASDQQVADFYAAANASIGEPYDLEAIIGFALPGHHHGKFHAICSAKMFLLLRSVNWFPWPVTVPAHSIDPRDLLLMISCRIEVPHEEKS